MTNEAANDEKASAIDNTPPLGIDRRAHASVWRLREAHRIGLTHARKMLPEGGSQCVAGVRTLSVVCYKGARRLLAVASCHAYVPGMTINQADYSVVVKHRAPPPKSWRWEIYRAGRSSPIELSPVYFQTMTMASSAGKEALKQLLDKLHSQRLRWPLV